MVERRKDFVNQTYYKWEIGHHLSGAGCSEIGETGEAPSEPLIKIRASHSFSRPSYTYFEGLVTLKKFERVKGLMLEMVIALSEEEVRDFYEDCFKKLVQINRRYWVHVD